MKRISPLAIAAIAGSVIAFAPRASAPGQPVLWIDPAWTDPNFTAGGGSRVALWFDQQLLNGGDDYLQATRRFENTPRSTMRRMIVDSLKALSAASYARALPALNDLESAGIVANCQPHWIVNSVTCDLPGADPKPLERVPGASFAFRAFSKPAQPPAEGAAFAQPCTPPAEFTPDSAHAPWSTRRLNAHRVWAEFGLTGRGVLNVVHDFGWTFAPPTIRATLWCNAGEIAGDGVDNDGNGAIDDVHGFNFDRGDAVLVNTGPRPNGGATHGDLTAAVLSGRTTVDSALVVGVAPNSQWSAMISMQSVESGVEWALETGADTYSMSFSLANLGELRGHWRRIMEHGALAGMFFVSGAGNFAVEGSPNYAPIPVQMRIPEDVPFAVFGVSGVGADGTRPIFSSQGPVLWRTVQYNEGEVQKPDFATINFNLTIVDTAGRAHVPGPNGWAGNSFAGPHTAGVIALMLEADRDLTPWIARDILVGTARDIDPPGVDMQTGAGLLDAYAAVQAVRARHRSHQ